LDFSDECSLAKQSRAIDEDYLDLERRIGGPPRVGPLSLEIQARRPTTRDI
jgi:hypothetical protein